MFNYEAALSAWRRSLSTQHTFLHDDLDELEQHVRDQVAALEAGGMSREAAFRRAMREMGTQSTATTEYQKVFWKKMKKRNLLVNELRWRLSMLKNYFAVALRSALRYKGYTFINVAGLSIGLAGCLLIFLFVQDELRYDRHLPNADRVFRVVNAYHGEDGLIHRAVTPPALGPTLHSDVPEVQQAVRLYPRANALMASEDNHFIEAKGYVVDSSFFEVFGTALVAGNPRSALAKPRSVVLTRSMAHKYFGDGDPMGRTLTMNGSIELQVTGLMEDPPAQTHLPFSYLVSFSTMADIVGAPEEGWSRWFWQDFFTYVRLAEGADRAALEAALPAVMARHADPLTEPAGFRYEPQLQPVTDIHLHSAHLQFDVADRGSLTSVRAFSMTAVFILLIACFNFINLATARSARRATEVGLRKVVGAYRGQLVKQFLTESTLYAFFSMVLALGLVVLILPLFNRFTDKALSAGQLLAPSLLLELVGACLLLGLAAGSYPAFFLSAFRPAAVLKGKPGGSRGLPALRKGLVVAQFSISILLALTTAIVFEQLTYLMNRDMGFDKEQVVVLPIRGRDMLAQIETLKDELERLPGVVSATAARGVPGQLVSKDGIEVAGRETPFMTNLLMVDFDYLSTFGIEVVAGRGFSKDFPTDPAEAYMLNETAARELGWTPGEALDKELQWTTWGRSGNIKRGRVIGVVRDFNVRSLHQPVEPAVLEIFANAFSDVAVRIRPGQAAATLGALEQTWKTWAPAWPFEYAFLDAEFEALYRSERKLGQLLFVFSLLAVLIACFGLFGLAAYAVEQRTKEIGIRKVLGASVGSLLLRLSGDFLKLVVAAFVLATPLAYLGMQAWLSGFAFRTDVGAGIFVQVGVLAVVIALSTIGYQTLRAALADPVKALRYE